MKEKHTDDQLPEIYNMPYNETIEVSNSHPNILTHVTKVPGGWVYSTTFYTSETDYRTSSTFVPYTEIQRYLDK